MMNLKPIVKQKVLGDEDVPNIKPGLLKKKPFKPANKVKPVPNLLARLTGK